MDIMSCRNSSEKNRELSNDIVVTIILLLSSKFCRSSMLSGAERRPPTTGFWNDSSIAPISRSLPSVQNRSMVCFRNKSLGTIMQVFEQHPDTTVAIMTSVFPVPVGITIVADLCDTVQCDLIAYLRCLIYVDSIVLIVLRIFVGAVLNVKINRLVALLNVHVGKPADISHSPPFLPSLIHFEISSLGFIVIRDTKPKMSAVIA